MSIENEIKEINFRMNLLRENTDLDKYLYDCKVKEEQWEHIREYFRELNDIVYAKKEIDSSTYETKILSFVDNEQLDYHFAEYIAQLQWEANNYKEVFETLYKDSDKFHHLF